MEGGSSPAAKSRPVVYILHGDDEHGMGRFVDQLTALMGDPGLAELNITRLDGRRCTEDELRTAATALPFLTERRLVLVEHPLARVSAAEEQKRFLQFLAGLPESTALVLMVNDQLQRKKGRVEWEVLSSDHWLVKWCQAAGDRARVWSFALPQTQEMPNWILQTAAEMGGKFTPQAALALAQHVDNDTRLAAQEIAKLLTYVDFQRPVEAADVERVTAASGQVETFDMIDALALGQSEKALRLLHLLLEQQDPLALFGMIVRQFRLLIQAREVLDEGGRAQEIERELRQHPYVAKKLALQAERFTQAQLEEIYRRLAQLDQALKSSQISYELAFDTFIAELALFNASSG